MTPQMTKGSSKPDRAAPEITQQMIEAGAEKLFGDDALMLSPGAAQYYSEMVLRAALPLSFRETRKSSQRAT